MDKRADKLPPLSAGLSARDINRLGSALPLESDYMDGMGAEATGSSLLLYTYAQYADLDDEQKALLLEMEGDDFEPEVTNFRRKTRKPTKKFLAGLRKQIERGTKE